MYLQQQVYEALVQHGLTVHEMTFNDDVTVAIGWEFRSREGIIMPKAERLWRLDLAIQESLQRGAMTGRLLSKLVGHFVSMALLRRVILCTLTS